MSCSFTLGINAQWIRASYYTTWVNWSGHTSVEMLIVNIPISHFAHQLRVAVEYFSATSEVELPLHLPKRNSMPVVLLLCCSKCTHNHFAYLPYTSPSEGALPYVSCGYCRGWAYLEMTGWNQILRRHTWLFCFYVHALAYYSQIPTCYKSTTIIIRYVYRNTSCL